MGQEIVYCCRCQTRLTSSEFEKGSARRLGDSVCCTKCVPDYLASLSPEERQALEARPKASAGKGTTIRFDTVRAAAGSTTARRAPTPETPRQGHPPTGSSTHLKAVQSSSSTSVRSLARAPQGGSKPVVWIAAAVGGFIVVVILIAALSGGKRKAAPSPGPGTVHEDPDPNPGPGPAPNIVKPPVVPSDPNAPEALRSARQYVQQNPADLIGQLKKYEDARFPLDGTPWLATANKELEDVRTRLKAKLDPELAALGQQVDGHLAREEFSAAREVIEKAESRHPTILWSGPLGKLGERLWDTAEAKLAPLKQKAVEARRRGDAAEATRIVDQVRKWGLQRLIKDLDKALSETSPEKGAAPPPPPKTAAAPAANPPPPAKPPPPPATATPLSKEAETYLKDWQKAMAHASARRYDVAIIEIESAAARNPDAAVKKEAAADVALLRQFEALHAEAQKALAAAPRGQALPVTYVDDAGARQGVTEKVVRAERGRVELARSDPKQPTLLIEYASLAACTIADLFRNRAEKKPDTDAPVAAALCLVEGDAATARAILEGAEGKVAPKYWPYAGGAPAHKPAPRELEARQLFHAAHRDWHTARSKGEFVEKYKTLARDFADTAIARHEAAVIARRAEHGKEYFLTRHDMVAAGAFKAAVDEKAGPCWTSDADSPDSRNHYVEVEFGALPSTEYKAWVYAGACCAEKFAFDLSATDLTYTDPKTKKVFSLDPGRAALPVNPKGSIARKTHAQHGQKKDPTVWHWVPLPLSPFPAPGPKTIRLMTDRLGLSVAAVVVSSTRTAPPKEDDLREALKARPERKGTPDPVTWLVVGPFDAPGDHAAGANKVFPPEQRIDLVAPMETKAGPRTWAEASPEITPDTKVAFLNFEQMFNPKDHTAAFALIHVKAPAAMDARILAGSDDTLKVWVNGAVVHNFTGNRGVKHDNDTINIKLQPGWNRLLFKVVNGNGGYALAARVVDTNNRPIAGLEYDPFGDLPGARAD